MQLLLLNWSFDVISSGFMILLCLLYAYIVNFKWHRQTTCFVAGLLLLMVCVASPLHYLGEHYLFSAHMVSHTLILLIAAPLIVAGIPAENRLQKVSIWLSKKIIQYPFVCWLAGVGVMWLWHVPFIYNQLFVMPGGMQGIHHMNALGYMHLLSLFLAGMIFCLPIINPYTTYRIAPLFGVLYLTSACVFCSLLGLFITFAPAGTYTQFLGMQSGDRMLSIIRNDWNFSANADQQAGGLIMWVPCCFIYLSAAMMLLLKWFEEKEEVHTVVHSV